MRLDVKKLLAADHELLRVGYFAASQDVLEGPVGFVIVERFVQRDVRVERDVLLAGRRLDRRDDLAR